MTADASTESMRMGTKTPSSGVDVLDRVSLLLDVLEMGPATGSVLAERTAFSRRAISRTMRALTALGLVIPVGRRQYALGSRAIRLAFAAQRDDQVPRPAQVQRTLHERSTGVSALDRVSLLLDVLERGPATAMALIKHTGLSHATAYRMLRALTALDLVILLERRQYALGPRVIRLAIAAHRDGWASRTAQVQRELHELCAAPGIHTARLHQHHGPELTCIAQATRGRPSTDGTPLGADRPSGSDPVARTALAWQKKGTHADPAQGPVSAHAHIHQGWMQGTGDCAGRSHIVLAVPVPDPGRCSAAVLSVYRRVPYTANPAAGAQFPERVVERVIQVAARLSDWSAS